MKQLIYTLAITLFLAMITGCGGGSSTPTQEETVPNIQLPEDMHTPAETELPTDPVVETPEITAPVLKLSVHPAVDEILLNWNAVDNAKEYELEWGEMQDTLENSMTFDANQIQYLHQDLEPETIYCYRITAKYAGEMNGKPSEIVAVKTGSVTQIMQSDVAN